MGAVLDLTGQRFGRLVALRRGKNYVSPKGNTRSRWVCICDCGNQGEHDTRSLRDGTIKSCGCLRRELTIKRRTKHGQCAGNTMTKEYSAWHNIIDRCTNKNHKQFEHYGGSGIAICEEWRESFETFYNYIGPAPSPKHSIDRIDNSGNYEPGNVRWATWIEQARNKRNNRLLTYNEETLCAAEWSRKLDIKVQTLRTRLRRGWSAERALETPIAYKGKET